MRNDPMMRSIKAYISPFRRVIYEHDPRMRILCYGDSNTWGYIPGSGKRLPFKKRWPGIFQKTLGRQYRIIEEGLNGRTTMWDDPIDDRRNGERFLLPTLRRHAPIDLTIIMLGSNDLKRHFNLSVAEIARGVETLCRQVLASCMGRNGASPRVLPIAPPPFAPEAGHLADFSDDAPERSKQLSNGFKKKAEGLNIPFFDAGTAAMSSRIDGVHWDAGGHRRFGDALAGFIIRDLCSLEKTV